MVQERTSAGRPEATSHAAIEQAAFRLFAARGFEATTIDAIAAEVGVSRRTLFRYFPSKNDIPWGQFDRTVAGLRTILAALPSDLPLADAVGQALVRFNEFPPDASPSHRDRMRLILETPALQAHSVLRYEQWRAVIAEYAAGRLGLEPHDLEPQLVGQVSLSLSMVAYASWLRDPDADLPALIERAVRGLQDYARRA